MIWIILIICNLFIGMFMGAIIMYYRNRNLLKNHQNLFNELQNNKNKLNEYQKKLNNHFTSNIELLKTIAENYQNLYQNMTKNANFFLPNIYPQDNMYVFRSNNIHNRDSEPVSVEAPLDYSDDTKIVQKHYDPK